MRERIPGNLGGDVAMVVGDGAVIKANVPVRGC
jgi:hypothetical protein